MLSRFTPIRSFGYVLILHACFHGPVVSQSEQPTPIPPIVDASKIKDPKTLEVINQIAAKLAEVKEYVCTMKIESKNPKGNLSSTEQIAFRRPDLHYSVETQTEHAVKRIVGQRRWIYDDGKTRIEHVQPAAGSEQDLIEMFRGKISEQDLQKKIQEHLTPKAYRYNLAVIRQAGIEPEQVWNKGQLIKPFYRYDAASIKLEQETEDAWVFSAKYYRPLPGVDQIRITFGGKDGLLKEVQILGKQSLTMSFSEHLINPEPKLQDDLFKYKMPPGAIMKIDTDGLIKSLKEQGY